MERSTPLPYTSTRGAASNTLDANTEMQPDSTRLRLISETPSVKLCCARDAVGLVIDGIHDHLSTHSAFEGTDISRLNNSSDIGERPAFFAVEDRRQDAEPHRIRETPEKK